MEWGILVSWSAESKEGLPQKTSLRPHGLVQTGNLTLDSVQGFCVEVKT